MWLQELELPLSIFLCPLLLRSYIQLYLWVGNCARAHCFSRRDLEHAKAIIPLAVVGSFQNRHSPTYWRQQSWLKREQNTYVHGRRPFSQVMADIYYSRLPLVFYFYTSGEWSDYLVVCLSLFFCAVLLWFLLCLLIMTTHTCKGGTVEWIERVLDWLIMARTVLIIC